jgi:4-hydroxyphenylpyruvate dioxygenase
VLERSPQATDDDALAAAQLRALAERAAEHGIRIAYEALAWGRHVRDYEHAWRIVEAAGHPSLGTCLDSFHILSRGGDPHGIGAIPAEKIFFLQLADAPDLVMDVLQWSRHYRCFPGQGGFDLAAFLDHVITAGYEGPLSLEVFNDVFRQADPGRMAVDAMRSLLLLEEAARLADLPPPAALRGYAFVELAVAPGAAAGLERMLIAMGFRHAGQHRTKPVQLWRHGQTRILVNHEDATAPGPRVAAIAVESADPGRLGAARRAAARAGPATRSRARRGRPLGDRGPRRDLGLLLPHRRRRCRQLDRRLPDSRAAGAGAGSELTGIDHVALSQPFDYFDEAALFYRSVLGLELEDGAERAAPEGLVRSRAASSADRRVRFALNVPVVGTGGSELQHVAFACTDCIATAQAMRDRGVPLLDIPRNYYEDLAARTELEPALIRRMRELGVLYDAIDGGELLHFYTAMAGSTLFFEVLERRGGYEGYGAANSPVRMAAQRRD